MAFPRQTSEVVLAGEELRNEPEALPKELPVEPDSEDEDEECVTASQIRDGMSTAALADSDARQKAFSEAIAARAAEISLINWKVAVGALTPEEGSKAIQDLTKLVFFK